MILEISHRPLILCFFALCAGMMPHSYPLLLFILPFIVYLSIGKINSLIFTLSFYVTGWILAPLGHLEEVQQASFLNAEASVISVPKYSPFGTTCEIESSGKRYLLQWKGQPELSLSDEIKIHGIIQPFSEIKQNFWKTKAVLGSITPSQPIQKIKKGFFLWQWGVNIHQSFTRFTSSSLLPKAAAVLNAICLSDRSSFDPSFQEAAFRSGTLHIFSVSGLHVILVASLMAWFFRFFPLPRSIVIMVEAFCLFLYVAATGLQAPAVRAAIVCFLASTAFLWHKESDSLSALSFAGIVYLLWQPYSLLNLGFQLSFVCTGALILFGNYSDHQHDSLWKAIKDWCRVLLKGSLIATVASTPLLAYHLGQIPTASLLANLLILPILPVLMMITFIGWIISLLFPIIASGLSKMLIEPLAGWIRFIVDQIGTLSWSTFSIPQPSIYLIFLLYVLFLMLWRPYVRKA